MNKNEKLIEALQECILDKGIVLEGRMEKAVLQFGKTILDVRDNYDQLNFDGTAEQIQKFKDFILKKAPDFNVRIK